MIEVATDGLTQLSPTNSTGFNSTEFTSSVMGVVDDLFQDLKDDLISALYEELDNLLAPALDAVAVSEINLVDKLTSLASATTATLLEELDPIITPVAAMADFIVDMFEAVESTLDLVTSFSDEATAKIETVQDLIDGESNHTALFSRCKLA